MEPSLPPPEPTERSPRLTLPKPEAPPPLRFDGLAPPAPPRRAPAPTRRRATARLGLGLTLLGCALAIGLAVHAASPVPERGPPPAPDIRGAPAPAPAATDAAPVVAPVAAPTQTPVLSVITRPPGAQVEIGGAVYGTSPLVRPSPHEGGLQVRLRKAGYGTWRGTVQPRDNGHYVLDVTLTPR